VKIRLYYALEALGVGIASARSALDCTSAICSRGRRRSGHATLRETEVELGEKQSTTVDWVLSERRKCANKRPFLHSQAMAQVNALLPFKVGPANSGLRLKASVAPGTALPIRPFPRAAAQERERLGKRSS
jgi:hypothetical protein